MTDMIQAATLDDALLALARRVGACEKRGEKNIVFCEDRLTLLTERAILRERGGTMLTEVTTFKRFLKGSGRVLSKQGSVMALSAIISAHQGELKCFGRGAAQAVYETVAQLSASCVDDEMLLRSAEQSDGMLRYKLLDLAFLLEKYNAFLRERGMMDENGYLALLPEQLASGALEGANVFFFAFPSFTRQALEGVRAAMRNARSVTGVFLCGRQEFYTGESVRAFRTVAEEMGEARISTEPCSLTGEAAVLHGRLFSTERGDAPMQTERIRLIKPLDETEELSTIAALIRKNVAEGKRYRDFTVLVPDKDYFLAVERAFTAFRIPFYADKKRAFSEHPFCVFVLAVLSAVQDGVLPDEADDVAASIYFGEGDAYRNYLLEYGGYRGAVHRSIREGLDPVLTERLSACRERMRAILKLFSATANGSVYAQAVRSLYDLVGGDKVTESLQALVTGEERAFLGIDPLWEILSEIEGVAGERSFTAREFATVLRGGMESLERSMLPQHADAVFVGDITESRICRSPVLFCAGLTDALPLVSHDTAIISDGDIDKLSELKVEIEPAIAVVNARAREGLALNLCAFTEALYVSCPARKGGSEALPSEVFTTVCDTFQVPVVSDTSFYACAAPAPTMLCACGEGEDVLRASAREALRRAGAEIPQNGEKHAVPEAGELYFSRKISPSLLEDYFKCPYMGFISRGLSLKEREERTVLDAADAGNFVHTVLEESAKRFGNVENEEACRALALQIAEELLGTPQYSALGDTAAGGYAGARIVQDAVKVTLIAYRQLKNSLFSVGNAEEEIHLPALNLKGRADRVDEAKRETGREKPFVRIIDYKTGNIDDSPAAYYTGRKLQLQLYLRGASQDKVAAGAFYFPAADEFAPPQTDKFQMKGFYCGDDDTLQYLDTSTDGGAGVGGHALPRAQFEDFLDYAVLVSQKAIGEMKEGNLTPSPYKGACTYCDYLGMCGFTGAMRKADTVTCEKIADLVRSRKEGEK